MHHINKNLAKKQAVDLCSPGLVRMIIFKKKIEAIAAQMRIPVSALFLLLLYQRACDLPEDTIE